jgi:hypothetical protein
VANEVVTDLPMGGNDITNAGSVSTGDVSIAGAVESVAKYGAEADATTDDSQAFKDAADAVGQGIVWVPPGHYRAQEIPVRDGLFYLGAGPEASIIESVDSSDTAVFLSDNISDTIEAGGIRDFKIIDQAGDYTNSSMTGIDFSPANRVRVFEVVNNKIRYFDRGIEGSQQDRDLRIERDRIEDCGVGLYVNTNHPIVRACRFASCGTGIGGDIYDCLISDTKFTGNDVAAQGLDGGTIDRTYFNNCIIFANGVGLELGSQCTVNGGLVTSDESSTRGIVVNGQTFEGKIQIQGVEFDTVGGDTFDDAAIWLKQGWFSVTSNTFKKVGTILQSDPDGTNFRPSTFSHNSGIANDHIIRHDNGNAWFVPHIIGNAFTVSSMPANDGLYHINNVAGFGFQFINNLVYGEGTISGDYLSSADADNALIKNNRALRITGQTLTGTPTANEDNVTVSP